MSVLTKPDIIAGLRDGSIVVDPEPSVIGPNSIDLRLHNELRVYNYREGGEMLLDAREDNPTTLLTIPERGLRLMPAVLYLGRTVETTYTPKHVPLVGGRSSTGRLGIDVHCTAGKGDVGFRGTWTLEIKVVHPVIIYPNMRFAQLWLFTTSSDLAEADLYSGRYQDQKDVTASRGHIGEG
jgi:dCTP deaminase